MAYQIALDSSTAASQNEGNPANGSYAATTPASFTFDLTRGAQQVLNDGTTYHYTIQNVSGDSLTTPVENGFVANTGDFTTSGGAGNAFTWTGTTAQIVITAVPDTTVESNETFSISVTDDSTGGLVLNAFASTAPVVTLTNDDFGAPVFSSVAAISAAENQTAVGTVTAGASGAPGAVTYAIHSGADGGANADASAFTINATTGVLTFNTAPNFESPTDAGGGTATSHDNVYDVEVDATQNGVTGTQAIAVTVTDVDEAPTVTSNGGVAVVSAHFNVNENTTAPVTSFAFADPDANDTDTWSINGGADGSQFTIDPHSGVLSFATAPDYEHPTDSGHVNSYTVQVAVTDSGGLAATQTVTVDVHNLDEPPVVTSNGGGPAAIIHVADDTTSAVTTFQATSQDGDTITYSDSGTDHNL